MTPERQADLMGDHRREMISYPIDSGQCGKKNREASRRDGCSSEPEDGQRDQTQTATASEEYEREGSHEGAVRRGVNRDKNQSSPRARAGE